MWMWMWMWDSFLGGRKTGDTQTAWVASMQDGGYRGGSCITELVLGVTLSPMLMSDVAPWKLTRGPLARQPRTNTCALQRTTHRFARWVPKAEPLADMNGDGCDTCIYGAGRYLKPLVTIPKVEIAAKLSVLPPDPYLESLSQDRIRCSPDTLTFQLQREQRPITAW